MKRTLLFLLPLLIYSSSIFSQNELTETQKLAVTAKIWGFLKYYHPHVAEGNYNWDEQLFKIILKTKKANNTIELSQIYIDLIDSLGEVEICNKCKPKNKVQYFNKNLDLKWLNNEQLFTVKLSNKLNFIKANRHQGEKKYVEYYSRNFKIANFTNEIDYENFDWQDENLRLLSLFRYWNMIEYFFPAKYQTDKNWNSVLNQMIPKFLYPKSETDLHLAMSELVVSLDDSHVKLNTDKTYLYFGHYYLPVQFKLIENQALITGIYNDSLAKINNLKMGDIIVKVDDVEVESIFTEKEKYISGSNMSRKRLNASYYLLNGPQDSLKVEVIRDDKLSIRYINRYLYQDFNYQKPINHEEYKILKGDIGYVDIGVVEDFSKTMKALINTKAIIFDLRKTSSSTPFKIANYITSQKRDFYKAIVPDLDYPGRFIWTRTYQAGTNSKLKYNGKVILLVDENCQSQREFTAMCLQTGDNVTTIGSQTSGADGNVVVFNMVGGYRTQITGAGIFYPDGTETQRNGVRIDIEVNSTIEGIKNGKDEILERAIQFANE
ncbi:S41 family peptidase [Maribacter sp. Asnod1-A12]|uniref:S41 family peptidase n=1 Tax=Maribacter sp. Asnod1-A12 TaxID=3160576 RepID=UPI003869D0C7